MDTKMLHERILYPTVRVKTDKAGGSGVVIYSKPDPRSPSDYLTFVLTNWHVISEAIKVDKKWDSVRSMDVKREVLNEVTVESFSYVNESTVVSSNAHKAEIVAYNEDHDLALLRVLSPIAMVHVAEIIPKGDIPKMRLFDETRICGCSLLHDPLPTKGEITGIREVIQGKEKEYLMTSAPGIFGNSGGALFDIQGRVIGVVSRLTAIQLGFGVDLVTWMIFAAHPVRLYRFFEEQELYFLFDEKDDYHKAMKRREDKRKKAQERLAPEPPEPPKETMYGDYGDEDEGPVPYGGLR